MSKKRQAWKKQQKYLRIIEVKKLVKQAIALEKHSGLYDVMYEASRQQEKACGFTRIDF